MLRLTWFSLLSLLWLDLLACSQKRKFEDDVHVKGVPQKRVRKEKDAIVLRQKGNSQVNKEPKEVTASAPSASRSDTGSLSEPLVMKSTTAFGSDVSKQEQPIPAPIEQQSSQPVPIPSVWWSQYREGLKRITLDGQDVAVTLEESESFLLDLPFLECVLPSMRSREIFFVPVFIRKILLPYFKNGRKQFTDHEYKILKFCRGYFFMAMNGYLELLFIAAALEDSLGEGANTLHLSKKALELVTCIRAFFEVRPLDDFLGGEQTFDNVKARLARRIKRIPAMLMIGQQWGFDAQKVATNIKRMGCMDPLWLESIHLSYDRNVDAFLDLVIKGIHLPDLRNWSIAWIAWTIKPDFSCFTNPDTGEQMLFPRVRFESTDVLIRPASSSPTRECKQTIRSILAALELKGLKHSPQSVPTESSGPSSSESKSTVDTPLLSSSLNQRQPITAGSTNALRTTSMPRYQPRGENGPEFPRPHPVFSAAPKTDEELPNSPIQCLSGFNDDPLELFDAAVTLGNPSTDYDPMRAQGFLEELNPETSDLFDFLEYYNATQG